MPTIQAKTTIYKLQEGKQGEPGLSYKPLRIQLWDKIGMGNTLWSGIEPNADFSDIVFTMAPNGQPIYYRCIRQCTKDPNRNPGDAYYNSYFIRLSTFQAIATEVLLAGNADIGLLSTNAVQMKDGAGNVCGEVRGSANDDDFMIWLGNQLANPMFGVTGNGKQYLGGTEGRHIELDPTTKEIRIYDDSGALSATHSGKDITATVAIPSATSGNKLSSTISFGTRQIEGGSSESYHYAETINKEMALSFPTGGVVEIIVPQFTISVKTLSDSNNATDPNASVYAEMYLDVYDGNTLLSSTSITRNGKSGMNGGSWNVAARTVRVSGKPTKAVVRLMWYATNSKGLQGQITIPDFTLTAQLSTSYKRCEYGANGWAISYDNNNYSYLLIIGGKMHFCVVSGGEVIAGKQTLTR